MFIFFTALIGLLSLLFLKHYYPLFKEADDLFSIAGFIFIYIIITALIAVMVYTPYYLLLT
ncbi:MAG: hypothetical protein ACPG8F_01730 [Flavobacteriaceae bacterium]